MKLIHKLAEEHYCISLSVFETNGYPPIQDRITDAYEAGFYVAKQMAYEFARERGTDCGATLASEEFLKLGEKET